MCGIAGYIGSTARTPDQISKALQVMYHRGPDANGSWSGMFGQNYVSVLHTRLSIIDLDSRSNQPFVDQDALLVFNGEIYNYKEIRAKLENLGFSFATTGDTEVLFYALKYWGKEVHEHLEGMWAFAFLDFRKNLFFLSRDRFGEKPLYLHRAPNGYFFGSDVRAIEALSGSRLGVNENHILRYLVAGYKSLYKSAETFFDDVIELEPGKMLSFSLRGDSTVTSYWHPALIDSDMSRQEAVEGVRERLIESMRLRIRSDVPMAFCLSGGVDSVSLTSIAVKVFKTSVETYSIIDSDERYNEWVNISSTIDDLSCNNIAIYLEPGDHLGKLSSLIANINQPVATITYYIFSLLIEHLAGRGIKTVITGTGADELLTGYYDHFILHLHQIKGHSSYNRRLEEWREHILPIVRNPHLQDPELYDKDINFREHIYFKQEEFIEYLRSSFYENFTERNYHHDLLKNRMLNELFHESCRLIINEVDMITMRYSVEGRNPFLDRNLFEFAFSIPTPYLIQDGYGKSVLRDAMKGIINDKVRLDRQKRGFNASIASIADFKDRKVREAILDNSPIYDLVRKDKIEQAMSATSFPNSFSKFLFSFLSAKFFLEQRA